MASSCRQRGSAAAPGGARLARLLSHLDRPSDADGRKGALDVVKASATAAEQHVRSFMHGLAAHLILVPSWVGSPAALVAGLVALGSPFGAKGVAGALALGSSLAMSGQGIVRNALCALVLAFGAAAPSGKRPRAMAAAGMVSMLAQMCNVQEYSQRPRLIEFFFRYAKDYYKQCELRLTPRANVRKEKTFFSFHPHGCLSCGWTINGVFNPEFHRVAGKINWLIDWNLRHKNPTFKMLCGAYRAEDRAIEAAEPDNIKELMSRGESMALIPGGFQDAVAFRYQREQTVVKDRKGFIKYCLQYGYRVHPVYTFGESGTYYTFTGLEGLRNWISQFKIPMVVFVGWPLCPFLPLPESTVLTYVGQGIDMPLLPEATKEEVDHWHGVYIEGLRQLFDEHKAEAGCPHAELEIL